MGGRRSLYRNLLRPDARCQDVAAYNYFYVFSLTKASFYLKLKCYQQQEVEKVRTKGTKQTAKPYRKPVSNREPIVKVKKYKRDDWVDK